MIQVCTVSVGDDGPLTVGVPARTAAVRKWVVVVLPLVPVTLAMRRPANSSGKALGASFIVTRPRMDAPEPFPAMRETVAAVRPASRASCSCGELRCL